MEGKSNFDKFVSRKTVRMTENNKRIRIILIIGAVLGIISMYFALSVVHKRFNPQPEQANSSQSVYYDEINGSEPLELIG